VFLQKSQKFRFILIGSLTVLIFGFSIGIWTIIVKDESIPVEMSKSDGFIRIPPSQPKDLLDLAFANLKFSETKIGNTSAIIVPHHLVAGRLIAETLTMFGTQSPMTIILISPDHFFGGKTDMSTSLAKWKTPYGILSADSASISAMVHKTALRIDESPFTREHGIYNILPFIKKLFPNAKIMPMTIKTNAKGILTDELAQELANLLPKDALFIASLDFSHEVTMETAEQQDAISRTIIEQRDLSRISDIAVDCRACISLLLKYTALRDTKNFSLTKSSNSARLLHRPEQTDVTSYLLGYFTH
jgi:AmmeMemoRadiSam system protein B